MESTQRAVVVTGASSGIGHACVQKLASSGFVVFAGVRKPSDGARLRTEGGDRVIPVEIDVTESTS